MPRKSRAAIEAEALNRRLNRKPPAVAVDNPPYQPPPPPRDLPDEEKGLWRDIAARYRVDVASGLVLKMGLQAHATWRDANARVRRDGLTIETTQGNLRPHPAVAIGQREFRFFLTAVKQLGVQL
jgi:Phage terminase, small subunit